MSERVLRLLDEIWSAQKGQFDEAEDRMMRMGPLIAEIRAIHETGASPGDEKTLLNAGDLEVMKHLDFSDRFHGAYSLGSVAIPIQA